MDNWSLNMTFNVRRFILDYHLIACCLLCLLPESIPRFSAMQFFEAVKSKHRNLFVPIVWVAHSHNERRERERAKRCAEKGVIDRLCHVSGLDVCVTL